MAKTLKRLSPLTVKSMELKADNDSVSDKKPDGGGLIIAQTESKKLSLWDRTRRYP